MRKSGVRPGSRRQTEFAHVPNEWGIEAKKRDEKAESNRRTQKMKLMARTLEIDSLQNASKGP